ncbi:acylphosphatase [Candidatus Gottesmanbacteria bacterium]|nr:acylphosphatase [Candidatus Gottesmanbacteria bacterium]
MKHLHLIISGDVQGVGFRAWVVDQAQDLGCVGWVKNRDDGAVEVAAEGEHANLEELIKRCNHGPEVAWVKKVDVMWEESTGEFVGFEVVY